MVVISAAVCTKAGKILVSRQFVEISKLRVEGLLAAFPKLLNPDQEHTFIETENVRYVYQPLESLYMLLITNKSSNIMEDLDTLHLLAKLVPEYCGSLEESRVQKNAFELIFAIDEVIVGGNKEKVSLGQIKTLTEMDSHEERIHEIVERNKAREAAEQAKLRMKEIDMQKKAGRMPAGISSQYSGGSYSGGSSASSYTPTVQRSEPARTATSAAPKKGMQLKSKTSQSTDFLKALKDAGEIVDTPEILSPAVVSNAKAESKVQKDNIHLDVEERISMVLNQDGGVEQLEIKGEIRLEIKKQEFAHIFVKLANTAGKDLRIRTHPNINKPLFSKQNILALKDTSKAFPVGPALGILKWTYSGTADSDVPLNITCWPTPGGDMTTVNLEFNLNDTRLELLDVTILVPIPDGHSPVVESVEGSYEYDVRNSVLAWKVPLINADNNEGALEFTIPYSGDASRLFPVQVFFNSTTLYSGVSVKSVNSVKDNEQELKYSSEVSFSTDPSGLQVQWC